jgi:hypothetical protein
MMEEQLIIEIWDVFKEYVPEKNREIAATQFVEFLSGKDVDQDTFESLLGYDPHLDSAVELILKEYDLDDDDDLDDEEDFDYGDDEDY